jgi:thymidylate synthase ThyX
MVHAELMTHRLFSRNSASSRAIPNEKLRARIAEDPALPAWWGKNQSGMQAREELIDIGHPEEGGPLPYIEAFPLTAAKNGWIRARDQMLQASEDLAKIGLHKQLCNRLVEPWMFITVILTATEWDNAFHQRDHKDAQPEIAHVFKDAHAQYKESKPEKLKAGEWHLPFINEEDWWATAKSHDGKILCGSEQEQIEMLRKVSAGRCARVSYLTHDGKRDLIEDVKLHDKLISGIQTGEPLHMSPFEHPAQAMDMRDWNEWALNQIRFAIDEERHFDQTMFGNVIGWKQYRKFFAGEHFRGAQS